MEKLHNKKLRNRKIENLQKFQKSMRIKKNAWTTQMKAINNIRIWASSNLAPIRFVVIRRHGCGN